MYNESDWPMLPLIKRHPELKNALTIHSTLEEWAEMRVWLQQTHITYEFYQNVLTFALERDLTLFLLKWL